MVACLVTLALGFGQSQAPDPPKVAVMYSSFADYAFRDEYDAHLAGLGWQFEKLENTEADGLVGRLGEFDLVITTGVANYEHPQDLGARSAEWLAWLQAGGGLLVTDASYDSVLGMWLGALGPGSELTSGQCAPYTGAHGGSRAVACDSTSPITQAPEPLGAVLEAKGGVWAHLESWGPAWRNLATCADGKSLLVARDIGKGCILATSFFRFQGDAGRPAATALFRNLWSHVQGLRNGLELYALDLGPTAPGVRDVRLALRSTSGDPCACRARVRATAEDGSSTEATTDIAAPAGQVAEIVLPFEIVTRGALRVAVEVESGGKTLLSLEYPLRIPHPVELTLADAHIYPERPELDITAEFTPPLGITPEDTSVAVLIDGRETLRVPAPPARLRWILPVDPLALGAHSLRVALREGELELGALDQGFSVHGQPAVGLRADGTILCEGRPFFPFGWYHVSWTFSEEERLQCIREIAAGGFNTVHAGIKQLEEWGPLLGEAERLGVRVVTEYGIDPLPVIERYRDRPAVLAWDPGDEPDGNGVGSAEMLRRVRAFKDLDPEHPTYMTACVPDSYGRYAGIADLFAPDPYPITRTGAATMPVYRNLAKAQTEAGRHGRSVIAVLQGFGYPEVGPWRVPTFAECRNMTYLALLAGAKGIIYYTFADSGFRVLEAPALWEGMKTLPPEIRALEPALTEGERTLLDTGAESVVAARWELADRDVVIVASTEMTERRQVAFVLPAGADGAPEPLFAGSADGVRVEAGQLLADLGPLEVRVVSLAR